MLIKIMLNVNYTILNLSKENQTKKIKVSVITTKERTVKKKNDPAVISVND